MVMEIQQKHKQILSTGLAYGLGLLLGNAISLFIFAYFPAEYFLTGNQVARLVRGILLAFVISGIGGLVGGAIGGWTLPTVGFDKGRRGDAWRSGVTFGIGYGFLIFPVILIISLLSFYDISSTPFYVFSIIFGLVGVIFGIIMGLSLGLWTVRRRFYLITRYSALGFGLGGMVLGYGSWRHIFAVVEGSVVSGPWLWSVFGFLFFGGFGGAGLGYAYALTAERASEVLSPVRHVTRRSWVRRWSIIGGVLLVLALLVRPVLSAAGDLLTPIDAGLSPVLDLPTDGTHWFDATPIATVSTPPQPAIATGSDGRLALSWIQDDQLLVQEGRWSRQRQKSDWQTPFAVTQAAALSDAQVAIDDDGRLHLAWIEKGAIVTSQCADSLCSDPAPISVDSLCEGAGADSHSPSLAVSGSSVLAVWENGGRLPYAAWAADGRPPAAADGCVPGAQTASSPHLAGDGETGFVLVFAHSDNEISSQQFVQAQWAAQPSPLGSGRSPAVTVDGAAQNHAVWCQDDQIVYWVGGQTTTVAAGPCLGRPQVAEDADGQMHVVWQADAVEKNNGLSQQNSVILESIGTAAGWTPAAIAERSESGAQAAMAAGDDGTLHLAWAGSGQLYYAAQVQYHCNPDDLSDYGETLYGIARLETYLDPADPVPFCQNRYDRLLITPNPDPAYSDAPTPSDGVYATMGDMIRQAEYEVLFSTMWYGAPANHDSPGSVIAAAIADLYAKVRDNPEQYPRGMTVRILLGNPPEFAKGETTGQLWTLIDDLRHAGIDRMVNEEIGWRLEVADFEGNMPHSHVKTIILDGKTASANGFNMTYDHFPVDHPSGQGKGRFDLGLQVTGPAAQATQRVFDDMWNGADQRHCYNLNPPLYAPWQITCFDRTAVVDHVPEVQKFYLPGGGSTVFSLYRSKVHDLADQQIVAALGSAKESIDAVHVNYSLDLICALNIVFQVCNVDISPQYQEALLQAAQNGAKIRLLVKPGPVEGIENVLAIEAMEERLSELGLQDRLEVRFFDGPVHAKTALLDDQLLIVGSQNLHYSAFGTGGGLTEYSLAIEDPQAAADVRVIFDYEWERATPSK